MAGYDRHIIIPKDLHDQIEELVNNGKFANFAEALKQTSRLGIQSLKNVRQLPNVSLFADDNAIRSFIYGFHDSDLLSKILNQWVRAFNDIEKSRPFKQKEYGFDKIPDEQFEEYCTKFNITTPNDMTEAEEAELARKIIEYYSQKESAPITP